MIAIPKQIQLVERSVASKTAIHPERTENEHPVMNPPENSQVHILDSN